MGAAHLRRHPLAGVSAGAGVLLAALCYALSSPPYEWWPLAWAVPGLLVVATGRATPRQALLLAVLFVLALGYGLTGWTFHATLSYFAFDRLRAAGFVLGLWLVCGLAYLPFVVAYRGLGTRVPAWARGVVAGWLWIAAEWLRTTLFTGMPWELLGHTQFRQLALVQVADLGGVYAVSFVMASVSVSCAELAREHRSPARRGGAIAAVALAGTLVLASLAYGRHARQREGIPTPGEDARTVVVVQANVPNEFRWKQAFFEQVLGTYAALTARARDVRPDLVVWPENAVNFHLNRESLLLAQLGPVAAGARDGLLVGAPRLTEDGAARNAAYLIGPAGTIEGTYDKQRLVPLAEYDPFGRAAASGAEPAYTAGVTGRPLEAASMRIGVVICYEILFPHLVHDLVRRGAEVLVNLSNDAWLDDGNGSAPRQHFSMAVFRAIETRRFLVRAAATGVSGFVAPTGETYSSLPTGEAGWLAGRVALRRGETIYGRFGDVWIGLVGLGLAAGLRAGRRRGLP